MSCGRMLNNVQRKGTISWACPDPINVQGIATSPFATMVKQMFKKSKRYPTVPIPLKFPVVGNSLHGPCNKKSAKPLDADTTERVKVRIKKGPDPKNPFLLFFL